MSIQDIAVTITGGTQNARALVAGLTTQALENVGFDSVINTVSEKESGEVPSNERVKTILDMCKATGHAVFNTPVTIEDGTVIVDDDETEDETVDADDE